ncbi:circadian-associated transcriptional repressor-like [Astyanax mexicanus]|uniref:Circadian-associated transcriptional repressor-like n=1 Tax=Astyanax mexicanus TaxID=7994 RepID=A0A8T2MC07_ASTMX|nr:circadian-associated transcriptional repressor-like [Astyanax mexicanus]
MQSLGSRSEWPSRASLSSNMHCLFSESDQTEDEVLSEASSEGGVVAGLGKPSPEPFSRELTLRPQAHLVCGDQQASRVESDQTGHRQLTCVSSSRTLTEGDLAFSRKCAELQGYIRPLLELLNGLKTGRYDRGLSTFQQSVAMDRLQRIVGILQKPQLGEKYMRTLLQVEMMLKVWFPRVLPTDPNSTSLSQDSSAASLPPRWHQNQLPVKKRRLSWSDSETGLPTCKQSRDEEPEHPSPTPTSSERVTCTGATSSAQTKEEDAVLRHQGPETSESGGGSCSDTQDSSVSSTTPTSDPGQATGKREVAVSLHTRKWVQDVNRGLPKKRAHQKSSFIEKQST